MTASNRSGPSTCVTRWITTAPLSARKTGSLSSRFFRRQIPEGALVEVLSFPDPAADRQTLILKGRVYFRWNEETWESRYEAFRRCTRPLCGDNSLEPSAAGVTASA